MVGLALGRSGVVASGGFEPGDLGGVGTVGGVDGVEVTRYGHRWLPGGSACWAPPCGGGCPSCSLRDWDGRENGLATRARTASERSSGSADHSGRALGPAADQLRDRRASPSTLRTSSSAPPRPVRHGRAEDTAGLLRSTDHVTTSAVSSCDRRTARARYVRVAMGLCGFWRVLTVKPCIDPPPLTGGFTPSAGGARWNRTTDLSIISAAVAGDLMHR